MLQKKIEFSIYILEVRYHKVTMTPRNLESQAEILIRIET